MSHSYIIIDPQNQLIANPGVNTFVLQPDVKDGQAKNIPIDSIRQLIQWAQQTAFSDQPRTAVILAAQNLQIASQNTLLKTLEEPSSDLTIILATEQAEQLLPTIRSRCQTLALQQLSAQQFDQWSLSVHTPPQTTSTNLPLQQFITLPQWQQLDYLASYSKQTTALKQLISTWVTETSQNTATSPQPQQAINHLKILHQGLELLQANTSPRLVANFLQISLADQS